MSIEAIKLAAEFNRYFTSANGVDVPAKVSVSRDEWRALFTAIQLAEAQQPATGEPVVDVRCEGCGYMTHHREHMGCVRAAKQHTHPAPSVPDEKPLPDLMMASYHEAIGWNACRAAMLAAK